MKNNETKVFETYKNLLNSKNEEERGMGIFFCGLLGLLRDGKVNRDNIKEYYIPSKFPGLPFDVLFAELDIAYFHAFGNHVFEEF